jgi:hypothetical protein
MAEHSIGIICNAYKHGTAVVDFFWLIVFTVVDESVSETININPAVLDTSAFALEAASAVDGSTTAVDKLAGPPADTADTSADDNTSDTP